MIKTKKAVASHMLYLFDIPQDIAVGWMEYRPKKIVKT